ncbi:MAG: CHASE3 domain-containing protein [Bauldia sp.]|nr:CHASE3 domain-containing protein [Bauldia sp.]
MRKPPLRAAFVDRGYAFRLRMLPIFVGVPALIVLMLVVAWGTLEREFASGRMVREEINASFERRSQLQRVMSLLQDGETSQRGYVITGRQSFLDPYHAATNAIVPQMDRLQAMLIPAGADPADVARLISLIRNRLNLFTETMNTRRAGDVERAEDLITNGEGTRVMTEIRNVINDLLADEADHLQKAIASETQVNDGYLSFTFYLMLAVGAFTVIGSLWAFLLLDRRQRAERAADRQGRLVRFLSEIADASNRATFDLALRRTLEVVTADLRSPWGLAFRIDPSGKRAPEGSWLPEPQGEDPAAVISFVAAEVRKLVGPVTIDLPVDLGVGTASLNLTLIPIRNGREVAGGLLIAGDPYRNPQAIGRDQRPYVMEQLSRAAERQRMADVVADSLARSEALFASASEGIVTVNESDTVERFNPAAEALFGYSAQEVARRNFAMLLDTTHAQNTPQRLVANSLHSAREITARRKDGSTFPAEISVGAMEAGGRHMFVVFIRDITERKQIERMQTEFISTVSHELRTPLTSIGGSLSLIVGGAAGEINERAKRLLEIAGTNTQRLIRLVNDILDIEKLQSGRMAFQFAETPVDDVVAQVIAANRGFADNFGVQLRQVATLPGVKIRADTDRLNQAITNLVSNAVKFSPRGASVDVGAIKTPSGGVRISVRDRGPGIPDAFRARMFERFSQADASDARQKSGSGLGLSIAREIVHRHGGVISFETQTARGTVFHIDLKTAVAQDDSPIRALTLGRRLILVCVQSEADAGLVTSTLAGADFACEVVFSREAAIAAVSLNAVQAAVVDIAVVGEDVSGFIRAMQDRAPLPSIPVVLLSLKESRRGDQEVTAETLPVLYWAQSKNELAQLPAMVGEVLAKSTGSGKPSILHVEDDRDVLEVVRHALQDEFQVIPAPSLEMARQRLSRQQFQLVILDLSLSDGAGRDLLPDLVGTDGRPLPIVVFSAQEASPDLARQVHAVLTKSRSTLATLVEAVRAVLSLPSPPQEQKARYESALR